MRRIAFLLLPLLAGCAPEPRSDAAPAPPPVADLSPPVRDLRDLRFEARTTVEGEAPAELRTVVTVTNTGAGRVELQWGNCALRLRAYRTETRTGAPVWRSERRAPPWQEKREGLGAGYVCLAYLAHGVVDLGEAFSPKEFAAAIPVHEVLGDSLPDGRYWFTAELELVRDRPGAAGLDEDTVRLAAGDAYLVARIDSLPEERTFEGVRYRVRTNRVPGEPHLLRVSVTATNTGRRPVQVAESPSSACPLSLLGYRTRERRDTWYMTPGADWNSPARCAVRIPPTRLGPGESRTFSGEMRAPYPDRGPFHLAAILQLRSADGSPAHFALASGDTGAP